ncbi:hypothetical protein F4678DRAFT_470815 [Xylaria arbuscula]|nr:hypothetical protein F4678DRAFT_470815 [Xylaria arbuscula]
MLMFRFWNSDHRGSDKTLQVDRPMLDFTKPVQPWIATDHSLHSSPPRPLKRRRQSNAAIASQTAPVSAVKRPRTSDEGLAAEIASPLQKKVALDPLVEHTASPATALGSDDIDKAKDVIEEQLGLEILLKHNELRLINQELAKCQVALEQLRRCHLIPYPVNVPTPEQMLKIASGSGPSLQPKPGDKLPQWAPPFGVTDGPYARHYAKWLIPDPKFDGIQPDMPADSWRMRSAIEGRSTRNSLSDFNASQGKSRPARGTAGQKLQALSSGYPPPKDKSGPCTLKRSDGQTVKLVCIDCHRENFSSTQGFINHCRIAHKRDFKSHEEAAVHCGHPIEAAEVPTKGAAVEEKPVVPSVPPSGLAHPFTRANGMTDSEACFSVVRRIQQSLDLYRQGRLHGVSSIPTISEPPTESRATAKSSSGFTPSASSPHLSRLLKSRGFDGNLGAIVEDAKTRIDLDQLFSPTDDESEDRETSTTPITGAAGRPTSSQATTGMRVPARTVIAPVSTTSRPSSSKGAQMHSAPYVTPIPTPTPRSAMGPRPEIGMDEDMLDVTELSPNTAISNNAPSLVSDDGEYDDSADSDSASEMGDSIGADTISDVDDIDIDEDHAGARTLRHHGSAVPGAGTRMRLGKGNTKRVNFVGVIKDDEKAKQGHGSIDIKRIL